MDFRGSHILSIDQFDRSDIEKLFSVADKLEPYASKEKITRVLEGAILGNMFLSQAQGLELVSVPPLTYLAGM